MGDIKKNYKELLRNYIITDNDTVNRLNENENIDDLISSFSLYIKSSGTAYKYNLAFMPTQYAEFTKFIMNARKKCILLRYVVNKIKNSDKIKKYLNDYNNKKESSKVRISINDLLISDLKDKEEIDFHERFSISGANRKLKADIFTIKYEDKDRQVKRVLTKKVEFKLEQKELEEDKKKKQEVDYLPLINITEKVLGIEKYERKGD